MRAKEFVIVEATLASASISSWPMYLNRLSDPSIVPNVSLGDRGQLGSNLVIDPNSIAIIKGLNQQLSTATDKLSVLVQIKGTEISFQGGSRARIGDIFKSSELKGKGGQIRLMGLVNEALLGIAMYAKLINRHGDFISAVSNEDIWAVVAQINPNGGQTISQQYHDRDHSVSDTINLSISVPSDVQAFLVDPNNRVQLESEVSSWVNYVNDSLSQRYADALYLNNRPDSITVELSGKEGGKIDVKVNVLDSQMQATRKLEQVKLSVKLSNSLIGQKARGKNVKEVYDNLVDLFKFFDVDLYGRESSQISNGGDDGFIKAAIENGAMASGLQNQYVNAMVIAYKQVVDQLQVQTGSVSQDARLASKISKFVDHHATEHNPNIQVIEKGIDGDYRLLSYRQLENVFKKSNIELAVEYRKRGSDRYGGQEFPSIIFYDRVRGTKDGKLLEIRFRVRGNYANHIVEPGVLLKDLAAYRRFK
jgi:hypothetical protein